MTWVSFVQSLRFSERTQVRLASRIMALAVFALFAVLLGQRIPAIPFVQAGAGGASAAALFVDIQPRADAQTRRRPPHPDAAAITAGDHASEGDGALRLWIDGPSGEVIFRSEEQFERCLAARTQRTEAADCPSRNDRRAMVLAATGERLRF